MVFQRLPFFRRLTGQAVSVIFHLVKLSGSTIRDSLPRRPLNYSTIDIVSITGPRHRLCRVLQQATTHGLIITPGADNNRADIFTKNIFYKFASVNPPIHTKRLPRQVLRVKIFASPIGFPYPSVRFAYILPFCGRPSPPVP